LEEKRVDPVLLWMDTANHRSRKAPPM
jgi:hypothetical protein